MRCTFMLDVDVLWCNHENCYKNVGCFNCTFFVRKPKYRNSYREYNNDSTVVVNYNDYNVLPLVNRCRGIHS